MKGTIFNFLADMIEETYGLEAWDVMLSNTALDGVYVSAESYPDEELYSLVEAAHKATGIDTNELIRNFGKYSFSKFQESHPDFCKPEYSLFEFLLTVDNVIHVEVKKLHPNALLPSFEYDQKAENELTMYYSSPRKLCMMAEGLIAGAAQFYQTEYELIHDSCVHNGDERCELHLAMK